MSTSEFECKAWSERELDVFQQFLNEGYTIVPRLVNEKKFVSYSPVVPTTFEKLEGYEGQFLFAKELRRLNGLIRFGETKIEGPPGCVHGGASAAMMDALMGTVVWMSRFIAVTLNLNVNYRKFIPINSTVRIETTLERVEGKKLYVTGTIKSLDGSITHVEATGLFYDVADKYKAQSS